MSVEMNAVTNGRISNDCASPRVVQRGTRSSPFFSFARARVVHPLTLHLPFDLLPPRAHTDHAEPEQNSNDANWNIGVGSLFAWSLGLRPAKDGFWTTPIQPGHPYSNNRSEPYGVMHGAIATLSCGPVSPADKIGLMNRTTIIRACMEDGTLLQPDDPARPIDAQIERIAFAATASAGPEGEVWATTTTVDSLYVFAHALVIDLNKSYTLTPSDLGLLPVGAEQQQQQQQRWIAVENAAGHWPSHASLYTAASGMELSACGKSDFQLHHFSPVHANGWALLGELEKYVPVSKQRIRAIIARTSSGEQQLEVTLRGVPGESIAIGFACVEGTTVASVPIVIRRVDCVFGESGVLTASVPNGLCRDGNG